MSVSREQPGESEARAKVLRLLVEHHDELFAFILSIVRNLAAAEDVMQDVAVVVCERWEQFTVGTDFGKWSRQIARYKILSERERTLKRLPLLSDDVIERIAVGFDEDRRTSHDHTAALRECLRKLRNRAREVVRLRYADGLNCAAIAERIGTTLTTVYKDLSRARGALAECVGRRLTSAGGEG